MADEERVRMTDYADQRVTLEGVPHDKMQGAVTGCQWFGVTDGKPEFIPRYEPLPERKEDETLLPFFSAGGQTYKAIDFTNVGHGFPSIIIQSLCGYNYTPANYKRAARLLETYGFVCCRSKRGDDGKFWELWWLPGDWAMRGALRDFYEGLKDLANNAKWARVIDWFCSHSSFGSLDLCCQRAAMIMD